MLCTRTPRECSKVKTIPEKCYVFAHKITIFFSLKNGLINTSDRGHKLMTYNAQNGIFAYFGPLVPEIWQTCLEKQLKWTDFLVLMGVLPRHMRRPLCSDMSNKKRGSWRKRVEQPHDGIVSSKDGKHLVTGKRFTSTCTLFCKSKHVRTPVSFSTDEKCGSCRVANRTYMERQCYLFFL